MNSDINLILDRKKQASDKAKRVARLRIFAGISLGIIIFSSSILFLVNQVSGIDLLLQKEQQDIARISALQKRIGKELLLQKRLADIQAILSSRSSPDTVIQQITAGMPSDVHIDSFTLTKKNVSLTVTSSFLPSLDTFTKYLLNKASSKQSFKTFTINSVIADPKNQKYILSFDTDLL